MTDEFQPDVVTDRVKCLIQLCPI